MRFITSLFRPKYLGKFINDSYFRVIFYVVFFVLLMSIPSAMSVINTPRLTYYSETSLFQAIYRDSSEFKIENNKLNDNTTAKVYEGNNIAVCFNSKQSNKTLVISFNEDYLTVIYNKVSYGNIKYEKLEDSSIDLDKIREVDFDEISKFLVVLNEAYDSVLKVIKPVYIASTVFYNIVEFAVIILIFLYFSLRINPYLPRSVRFKIVCYSLTWTFVLAVIGEFTSMSYLFLIGLIISGYCAFKGLRNLVVKINK